MINFTNTIYGNVRSTAANAGRANDARRKLFASWLRVLSLTILIAVGGITKSHAANTVAYSGGAYPAGNICAGAVDAVIQSYTVVIGSTTNHGPTNFTFTTGGGYATADIVNFKVWYNIGSNNFATATQMGSTVTTGLGSGLAHTTTTFTGIPFGVSSTTYIWITATIASSATVGDIINVAAQTASTTVPLVMTPTTGTFSGSVAASGNQTVRARPTVASVTASPTTLCTGGVFTLTAGATAGTGSLTSYNWTGPNSYSTTTATSPATLTASVTAAAGVYSLSVTYPGGGCTSTQQTSASVTVNATPTVITTPASMGICSGGTAFTTASGATTYIWTPGGATTNTLSVSPGSSQVYTVTGTTGTCSSIGTFSVNVLGSTPAIAGNSGVICPAGTGVSGGTLNLSDALSGGTWSSSNTTIATVGSSSGIVTAGMIAGTAVITYTACAGTVTTVVTVNTFAACATYAGCTTGLNAAANAANNISSVFLNGTSNVGTTGSDYFLVTTNTLTVTQNSTPTYSVSGTSNAGTLGVWIDFDHSGTYDASEFVGSNTMGAAGAFTYGPVAITIPLTAIPGFTRIRTRQIAGQTLAGANACTAYANRGDVFDNYINITCNTPAITGGLAICPSGGTTQLSDAQSGGVWISSTPAVATVGTGGLVTAVAASGTTTITYRIAATGCQATAVVTVSAAVSPISGSGLACIGIPLTLSDATGGGTWDNGGSSNATVDGSGVVTGVSAGTAIITYTACGGTSVFKTVTVNASPSISGSLGICLSVSTTTTLTATPSGGTWTSTVPAVGSVGSISGIVTGLTTGSTTISYTATSGCVASASVAVGNTIPTVTATASPSSVCSGGSSTLTATASASIVGPYTVASTTYSYVTASTPTGFVGDDGSFALPLPFTFYMYGVGYTTAYVSLNGYISFNSSVAGSDYTPAAVPSANAPVSGAAQTMIAGMWRDMINTGSGDISYDVLGSAPNRKFVVSWNGMINVNGSGQPNTFEIILYESTNIIDVMVTSSPNNGGAKTCGVQNAAASLGTAPAGENNVSFAATNLGWRFTPPPPSFTYLWTPATFLGSTTSASPTASGVTSSTVYSVTASLSGCTATATTTVNTYPTPGPILGPTTVCVGNNTTLTNSVTGGTWSVDGSGNVTINPTTGVATGINSGTTATITYTSCSFSVTATVSVNPSPVISGLSGLCVSGATTETLTGTPSGGTWISSQPSVATVGSTSGLVTAVSGGTTTISYTGTNGCVGTAVETVGSTALGITASVTPSAMCPGGTATLTATASGLPAYSYSSIPYVFATQTSPTDVTGSFDDLDDGTATITLPFTVTFFGTNYTEIHLGTNGYATFGTPIVDYTQFLPAAGYPPLISMFWADLEIVSPGNVTVSTEGVAPFRSFVIRYNQISSYNDFGSFTDRYDGEIVLYESTNVVDVLVSRAVEAATPKTMGIQDAGTTAFGPSSRNDNTYNINATPETYRFTPAAYSYSWSPSTFLNSSTVFSPVASAVTSTTTYTVTTSLGGCYATTTAVVSVNPNPGAILGNTTVCTGVTNTLSDGPAVGGTWSSNDPTIASIDNTSGALTGVMAGTTTVTYTSVCGLTVTTSVNVLPTPTITSPAFTICTSVGVATVTGAPGGGTWSASPSASGTINATTGVVNAAGTSGALTVTYTQGGCSITQVDTIAGTPVPIAGTFTVCGGATRTLTDATFGGVWASDNASVATVTGSGASGIVFGVAPGTATISYSSVCGGTVTQVVTVNGAAAITGPTGVCTGTNVNLTDVTAGGTWSSSNAAIGSVGSTTGVVRGITTGTVTISYNLAGCSQTYVMGVGSIAPTISGTITPTAVCSGGSASLASSASGGTVLYSSTSIPYSFATQTSPSTVSGFTSTDDGYATVPMPFTFNLFGTNYSTMYIGSNGYLTFGSGYSSGFVGAFPSASFPAGVSLFSSDLEIVSPGSVMTSTEGSAPNRRFVVRFDQISTYDGASGFYGDYSGEVILYETTNVVDVLVSAAASNTHTMGINAGNGVLFASAAGRNNATYSISTPEAWRFAQGTTNTLTYAWSPATFLTATTGSATTATGITSATTYSVTVTRNGCSASATVGTVTITPTPNPTINGSTFSLCGGSTISLSDASGAGTWYSTNADIATTGTAASATTTVTGISPGAVVIGYTTGCGTDATVVVTVNGTSPILGTRSICNGATTVLSNATPGGVWSSVTPGVATVGTDGTVTGMAAGTTTISYTAAGCAQTIVMTVNAVPVINGSSTACMAGSTVTTTLTITPGGAVGGTWTSSNTSNATIGSSSGTITGLANGTTIISYTSPGGCVATPQTETIAGGSAIQGVSGICASGGTTTLTDAITGGTWSISNGNATIGSTSGFVTGVSAGTSVISYSLGGCVQTLVMTEGNTPPAAISGNGTICNAGSTTTLSDATAAGTWSSSNTLVATVPATGTTVTVTGVNPGTATITYSTGCAPSATIVVSVGLAAMPWTEGFESIASPGSVSCNESFGPALVATANQEWDGTAAQVYNRLGDGFTGAAAAHGGSRLAGFGYNAANDYFFTPAFSLPAGNTYKFSFYYRIDNIANYYTNGYNANIIYNTVQSLTGATQFQSFSVAPTPGTNAALSNNGPALLSMGNTTYMQYTGYFTPANSGTFTFGINAQNAFLPYYWAFDDLAFDMAPSCIAPSAPTLVTAVPNLGSTTNLTVTAPAADSFLTIAMVQGTGTPSVSPTTGTNYAPGASLGGGLVIAKGRPSTATGISSGYLSPGTAYNFYTYAYAHDSCNGVAYSAASASVATFTTCSSAAPASPSVMGTPGLAGTGTVVLSGLPGSGTDVTIYAWTNAGGTIAASPASYTVVPTATSYTVTGVSSGANLWFTVAQTLTGCTSTSSVSAQASIPFALPYVQAFESGTLGNVSPNFMQGNAGHFIDFDGTHYGGADNNSGFFITPHAGTWDYLFFSGTSGFYIDATLYPDQWLVTPGLYFPSAGTYNVSFWYYDASSTPFSSIGIQYSNIPTLPSNTSTSMTSGTALASVTPVTGAWTQVNRTITVASGPQTVFLGFNIQGTTSSYYLAIDDVEVCQVPTVTVTNSSALATVCSSGGSLSLTTTVNPLANVTSGNWNYRWSGPGSFTSTTSASPSVTGLSLVGTNPVYVFTVTNSADVQNLCASTATTTATITPTPTAITGANSICGGSTAVFGGGAAGITGWSVTGAGASDVIATSYTTGFSVTTQQPAAQETFSVNYTNACGTPASKVVTINVQPAAITGGNSAICTLSVSDPFVDATGGGFWSAVPTTYGTIDPTTGIFSSTSTVGTAAISYTQTIGGCAATTNIIVGNTGPTSITGGSPSVCVNASTSAFIGAPAGGGWSSSDIAIATVGTGGNVTGVSPGTVDITYSTGCGTGLTTTVTVNGTTGSISNTSPVCTSTNFNLDGSSITPSSGTTYSWAGPVGAIITSGTSSVAVVSSPGMAANGTYTLTTTNNSCSNTYTTIGVISQTPPTPSISSSPASPICSGLATTLNATVAAETPQGFAIPVYTPTFSVTNTLNSGTSFTGGNSNDGYYAASVPFNFSFFGTTYNTVYIGTNGYVTFGSGSTVSVANSIPSASAPTNVVDLFQNDMTLASGGGTITYGVGGVAPNRTFVISYNAVSGNGSGGPNNGYIVLNETTNVIDAIVNSFTRKTGTAASCGITNSTGTVGKAAAGRNNAVYNVSTPEAWRFYSMNNYNYSWSPAASLVSTAGPSVTTAALASATTFSVSVADAIVPSCISSNTYTVNTNSAAAMTMGSVVTCVGATTVTAAYSGVTGTPTTYSINWDAAAVSAGFSATGTLSFPGGVSGNIPVTVGGSASAGSTYNGTITINNGTGCSNTYPFTVTTNAQPSLTVATVNGPSASKMCSGQVITLSVTGATGGGGLYTWQGPGILSTATTSTAALTYTTSVGSLVAGAYSVSLGSATAGCTTTPFKATAGTYSVVPQPSVTVSPSAAVLCLGGNFTMTASPSGDAILGSPSVYTWSGVNIATVTGSSATSPALTPSTTVTGGSYGVATTYSVAGCSAVNTATVTVNSAPTTSPSNDGPACVGGTITLSAGATFTTDYAWFGPLGYTTSGSSPSLTSLTTDMAGIYTVSVSNGSGSGCTVIGTTSVVVNTLATAPSNTSPACEGGIVTLMSNITGTAVSGRTYSWSGPIGYTSSVVSPVLSSVTTAMAGTYNFTVTATGSGCSATGSTTVTVNSTGVTAGNDGPACVGGTVNLTAAPSGSSTPTSYDWTGPDGFTSTEQNPVLSSVTADMAGTYTVVIGGGGSGCSSTSTTTVIINTLATAPSNTSPACVGGIVTLMSNITGTAVSGRSYSWDGPTGYTSSVVSPILSSVTTDMAGTYNFTVTATGSGCTATGSTTVTVNTLGITAGNDGPACVGGTINLTSTPTGDASPTGYSWSGPLSFSSGLQNPAPLSSVALGRAGTYTVTVIASGSGCTATATTNVVVNTLGITASNNGPTCVGLTTSLNSTPSGSASPTGFSWSGPLLFTAGTQNTLLTSVTTDMSGIYTVTVTALGSGCSAFATTNVSIIALPQAITGNTSVCVGGTTTVSDVTGGGTWSSTNTGVATIGTAGLSTAPHVVTGLAAGTATISYTVGTGCASTLIITVNPNPVISGMTPVCVGSSVSLSTTIAGGLWTAQNTKATVGSASGVVTGVTFGTDNITYTLPTTCRAISVATINPLPSAIGGTPRVCQGQTTTLNTTSSGGTWSSSNPLVATVGSTGGTTTVSGLTAGSAIVSYILPTGCYTTVVVTVNALSPITGNSPVCQGSTVALTDAALGGTWQSSNTAIATVGSVSGVVSGVAGGTARISYTTFAGCRAITIATVNPIANINGTALVCEGATTSLTDVTSGGTWSSSNGNATVGTGAGLVSGVTAGTAVISYQITATGCTATRVVTVNSAPGVINGTAVVCAGQTTTLTDAVAGGTWISSAPTRATVGSSDGLVTGVSAGTSIITYKMSTGGCQSTRIVTVNTTPGIITTNTPVCQSATMTLHNSTIGGTWSTLDVGVATVGGTGIVTGVSGGTALVSYTMGTGCQVTAVVTVNPITPIIGAVPVCVGSTVSLTDATPGGTWISSNTAKGTVDASGTVTGISGGTTTITYLIAATGCKATVIETVNALPAAIAGTKVVCSGGTAVHLSDATAGGTWSSAAGTGDISVDGSGNVTGVSTGTATVIYTVNGCQVSATVTVNASPAAITGNSPVCAGSLLPLGESVGGGTWSSTTPAVGTVSSSGVVTAIAGGTSTISYTTGAGCTTSVIVTVNTILPITGIPSVCLGSTTNLADATLGGTWMSSDPGTASVGTSGIVTGNLVGTAIISYTSPGGCVRTTPVTVNPVPSAIAGTLSLCNGGTTTLSDDGSGTWSSMNTTVATVGISSGIVTGASAGTATIKYTAGSGCFVSAVVTVNAGPSPIGGPASVCEGATINLSNVMTGGAWSTLSTAASVDGSGHVLGITAGTAIITYTAPTGGCFVTRSIVVNPVPAPITGNPVVCIGRVTFLADATTPGVSWTSGNTSVATISGSGAVTGISAGTANVTYSIGTGCYAWTTVSVNALPGAISGNTPLCPGNSMLLTDATSGGTWTSNNPAIASVGTDGTVTGVAGGNATISYTVNGGGCYATTIVTVTTITPVTGASIVCTGSSITLSNASAGGTWSSADGTVNIPVPSTGNVLGVSAGTATISYTFAGGGCVAMKIVTVNATPTAINGNALLCIGTQLMLTDDVSGGVWSSSNGAIAAVVGSTGVTTGMAAGTARITYAIGGCSVNTIVTVNTASPVTGFTSICAGAIANMHNATAGGTWSSSNTATGTISAGGVLSGLAAGTTMVSYTLASGCVSTATVTVNPVPDAIMGNGAVCVSGSLALSDNITGGAWSSSNGVTTVDGTTGVVTAVAIGTSTITYNVAGCFTTTVVTVGATPAAITGPLTVCEGGTIILNDATLGGEWTSTTGNATIGSSNGVVTGISAGTTTISYTLAGCGSVTVDVTINASPAEITGSVPVCIGSGISLTEISTGGVWSSSNGNATVDGSGNVSGVAAGTATISYTVGGCSATTVVTVAGMPAAITGPSSVCVGGSVTLNDITPGGLWSSIDATITIGTGTGVVTGVSTGTASVTYTTATGCTATTTISVNTAAAPISGPSVVCVGSMTLYTDATGGGTWSSSMTSVATVGTDGTVTGVAAGTTTLSYVTGGCISTMSITVSAAPSAIGGPSNVCANSTITLTDATAGGAWSTGSGNISVDGSGNVTGLSAGVGVVTYTSGSGCSVTKNINVNPQPSAVNGMLTVCTGATTFLTDATPGGVSWTSSTPSVATVSFSGAVLGVSPGTTTITYSITTGCYITAVVTVNAQPAAISNNSAICQGSSIVLTDATAGGTWSSNNTGVASIGTDGTMTGVAGGNATITYATYGAGCRATTVATVSPLPNAGTITGSGIVCVGATTNLMDGASGGVWSSTATGVATVNTSGVVLGVGTGTTTISYTVTNSCGSVAATMTVTVNALPVAGTITGSTPICAGTTLSLTDATAGGNWSSSNANATVDGSGTVTGVTGGTATISYTVTSSCGSASATTVVTINAIAPITGSLSMCAGFTTALSDATPGGLWSSTNTGVATVGSTSGLVSGLANGTSTISYVAPTGCARAVTVTVTSSLPPITGTLAVCQTATTALTDAAGGGAWTSASPSIATVGGSTGIVTGLVAGTTRITYTVGGSCQAITIVTVNPQPSGIGGSAAVCIGSTITLSDPTTGGDWSSAGNVSAAVTGTTLTTVTPLSLGTGTVTYTLLSTGCRVSKTITVNDVPTPILGNLSVCGVGSVTFLSDATSGTSWVINPVGTATVSTSGRVYGVSPGTATVTYTGTNTCKTTAVVTVNALVTVAAISGANNVSSGSTITLSDATPGGNWSSSNATIASVDAGGVVTGVAASGTANITYSLPYGSGCNAIASKTITVHTPAPHAHGTTVGGTMTVFTGTAVSIADEVVSGTWSSNNTNVATVDGAGTVTGIMPGTANITHIISYSDGEVSTTVTPVVVTAPPVDIRVVPNPNNGTFTIKGSLGSLQDEEVSVEVTDVLGQVVYRSKSIVHGGKINETVTLSNTLANGMYMLNMHSGSADKVFHFVIEK